MKNGSVGLQKEWQRGSAKKNGSVGLQRKFPLLFSSSVFSCFFFFFSSFLLFVLFAMSTEECTGVEKK